MRRIALFIFMLAACGFGLSAQSAICGTPAQAPELQQRTLLNTKRLRDRPAAVRELQYVPLTFHLIARSDGSDRAEMTDVFELLCYINQEFADAEMRFYIHRINEIDNNGAFQTPTNAAALLQSQRDPVSANIYVANTADNSGSIGQTLGYYSGQFDWIVMRKDRTNVDNNTIVHELGHFFSLLHPHNGWDDFVWDAGSDCAPSASPGGVPTELQDGSNCETAGDFVCDTPPDYNMGFGAQTCGYTGGARDPDCMEIDPQELLHMAYFLECDLPDYYFSPMQNALMKADLNAPERDFLANNFTPFTDALNAAPLTAPADGTTIDSYNYVELDWDAVDGANFYLLRVSEFSTLNNSTDLLVYGTSRVLADLDPSETYYWSITPLKADDTCTEVDGETRSFSTGTVTAIRAVENLSSWYAQPNPITTGGEILVTIEADRAFEAQLQLSDLSGRAVDQPQALRLTAGEQTYPIGTDGLSAGVYLLTLRDGRGVSRKRIVVQ